MSRYTQDTFVVKSCTTHSSQCPDIPRILLWSKAVPLTHHNVQIYPGYFCGQKLYHSLITMSRFTQDTFVVKSCTTHSSQCPDLPRMLLWSKAVPLTHHNVQIYPGCFCGQK